MPIGLLGILLATRYIPDVRGEEHERFDIIGMVLAGLGIGGMAFGLSVLGLNFLPWTCRSGACVRRSLLFCRLPRARTPRRQPCAGPLAIPNSDILRERLWRIPFRLGLGALPFLLPLMLQIGFGMTPFQSGMITFATALGAMGMKWATTNILRRFGFRNILVVNSIVSAAFLAVCAGFTAATPVGVMMFLLFVGGFSVRCNSPASIPLPMQT